ncbi:MAG: hypothetical protein ACP5RE_03480 [Candidatus Acidifodinimicrobium sp.]
MSHKPDDEDEEELRKKIKAFLQEGMTQKQIRKELGIGTSKLLRILKSIPQETPADLQKPPPTDQKIINQASEWASQKIASTLSDQIHGDYIGSMKAASTLKSAEMRYRKALEEMGWDWNDFVQQALDYGFFKAQEREKLAALLRVLNEVKQ